MSGGLDSKAEDEKTENRARLRDEDFEELLLNYDDVYGGIPHGIPLTLVLLQKLFLSAYKNKASDIHIEPFEEIALIRMRIDGVLIGFSQLPKKVYLQLITSIKVKASLNVAEKRAPQDGHFRFDGEDEMINVRVSVIPTVYGEKMVLRLLSDKIHVDNREYFGMSEKNFRRFRSPLESNGGTVYLSGPTGSGKSTTLYIALEFLSKENVNISTIEDPVEKNIFGVNQMQINSAAGVTFETGLRALLRQDPDIIMIGETRDTETARISARAAMTGHLVLSTLHTNSAASSFLRLKDMGVEPYMIASSVLGTVSQRLLRKVCPNCKRPLKAEDEHILSHGIKETAVGGGCEKCHYTGYSGRIAVHEVLIKDDEISKMIYEGASAAEIENHAVKNGMITMKECGEKLLKKGIISAEDFRKVLYK